MSKNNNLIFITRDYDNDIFIRTFKETQDYYEVKTLNSIKNQIKKDESVQEVIIYDTITNEEIERIE